MARILQSNFQHAIYVGNWEILLDTNAYDDVIQEWWEEYYDIVYLTTKFEENNINYSLNLIKG